MKPLPVVGDTWNTAHTVLSMKTLAQNVVYLFVLGPMTFDFAVLFLLSHRQAEK